MAQLTLLISLLLVLISQLFISGVMSTTFTMINKCDYTVWPGFNSDANSPALSTTGFALQKGDSKNITAPISWGVRMWGRTLCSQNSTGQFSCVTGDCGTNKLGCSGSGPAPPVTLVEFTLDGSGSLDFYDVSLVDGYNLPLLVVPQGGTGQKCSNVGCVMDLNGACPSELKLMSEDGKDGVACKSACEAFQKPQYCCTGAYSTSDTCKPSSYSQIFKNACPHAYSYAYDDDTSTFTCGSGPDYTITFCPSPNTSLIPPPSVPPEGPSQHRRNKIRRLMALIVGACVIIVVLSFIWIILRWKKKLSKNDHVLDVSFGDEFEDGMGPKKFSYYELASATNNFGEEQKLGEGGFGAVYKGLLKNLNTFVAVKKISKYSRQGSKEYTTEVKIISRLRHRNTVKLIGWCHERELMLVYEFMPNGSLDSHLFKGKSLLTWTVRYKIAQDVALALLYLHEEGDHCVLHRDIKSSNIMLDSNFNAKLGDFGLARLVDHAKSSQTTGWAGTMGYMAPECLTAVSKASKESDVFSYGVVALEIACGRRSIEHQCEEDQVSLVPWVWELYGNKRLLDTVDKRLSMNFDMKQMECLIIVGLWCAHPDRNLRPSIRQVIQVLNFELQWPNLPPKMPVPKYDMPTVQPVSSGNQPSQSLTILR